MQRNPLKLAAALVCAAVVVTAYAACYTQGYGVVVPAGTTKSFGVTCIKILTATPTSSYTMSDVRTGYASRDYGAWDYALNPPSPGSYWYSATRRLDSMYWAYYDCNGELKDYQDPAPPVYTCTTGTQDCDYP